MVLSVPPTAFTSLYAAAYSALSRAGGGPGRNCDGLVMAKGVTNAKLSPTGLAERRRRRRPHARLRRRRGVDERVGPVIGPQGQDGVADLPADRLAPDPAGRPGTVASDSASAASKVAAWSG